MTNQTKIQHISVSSPVDSMSPFLGFGAEWDSRHYREAGITAEDFACIHRRVAWMRLPVARIMMQLNWCVPTEGNFDFDTPAMQDLYRHLDVCEALDTTVFLTDWGCMPTWLRVPGITDVGDPRYADAIGVYLDHLINGKGYRCLRYFILVNEPNFEVGDFTLWRRGVELVAQVIRQRGLDRQIILVGADEVNSPEYTWHVQAVDQLSNVLGGYDVHRYAGDGEVRSGATEGILRRIWDYVRTHDPRGATKPCIVGEVGLGDDADHPHGNRHINDFEYGLFMADFAVQATNAGTAAVLAWMLDDNSHPGFFWGLWSSKADGLRLRPWFYPWALLCRLFPTGSTIHPVATDLPDVRVMVACTSEGWSACAVNRSDDAVSLILDIPNETNALRVTTYQYQQSNAPTDANGFPVPVATTTDGTHILPWRCPPRSVNFRQFSAGTA